MLGRVDGTITRFELRSIEGNAPRFGFITDRFEGIQILGGDATPGSGVRSYLQQVNCTTSSSPRRK